MEPTRFELARRHGLLGIASIGFRVLWALRGGGGGHVRRHGGYGRGFPDGRMLRTSTLLSAYREGRASRTTEWEEILDRE